MRASGVLLAGGLVVALSLASCGGGNDGGVVAGSDTSTTADTSSTSSTTADTSSTSSTTSVADSQLTGDSRLRLDGIGPVRVGMTPAEASQASGKRIRVPMNPDPDANPCAFAEPEGGPKVAFMVIDGRIKRVDVEAPSTIATVEGIRIGDSEAKVKDAYRSIEVKPHPYTPGGHNLVYAPPDAVTSGLLMIFETDGSKVTAFRAGQRTEVEFPEGCS